MWSASGEEVSSGRWLKVQLHYSGKAASYSDVIAAWSDDETFRLFFSSLLSEVPYTAYRWETPGVTRSSLSQHFEYVLLDEPSLARTPDPQAFAKLFTAASADVAVFPNLSGDAVMIVPRLVAGQSAYGHLAAFVRHAPVSQQHALWKTVALQMQKRVNEKPVWLSTAGAGVSWLHVRLDDRPKYYGHAPYRKLSTSV